MKPIPKRLLIHSATLKGVTRDAWQSETLAPIAALTHVRIDPSAKLVTDKQNRQVTLTAEMIYDCRNSSPRDTAFTEGQKVLFAGREYTIETIALLYDEEKLHHYELGLV